MLMGECGRYTGGPLYFFWEGVEAGGRAHVECSVMFACANGAGIHIM